METLEAAQARHRKELKDLQGKITNKKKNATKKTRKGVNDECAELERQMKEQHEQELAALSGGAQQNATTTDDDGDDHDEQTTNGVHSTTAESTPAATPAQLEAADAAADAEAQQQPGKKRNRQKDRLARRAAEQEAAAVAAEEEASGMTDHRTIEKTWFLEQCKANGLVEKDIAPDGHCMFSAVADQLAQHGVPLLPPPPPGADEADASKTTMPPYRIVRRRATAYVEAHADDFAPFLEEDLGSYAAKMRDGAEWGGQLELSALASLYGVEIVVLADGKTVPIEPHGGGGGKVERERPRLWLAYYRHGYGLGEHYNSLRKAP